MNTYSVDRRSFDNFSWSDEEYVVKEYVIRGNTKWRSYSIYMAKSRQSYDNARLAVESHLTVFKEELADVDLTDLENLCDSLFSLFLRTKESLFAIRKSHLKNLSTFRARFQLYCSSFNIDLTSGSEKGYFGVYYSDRRWVNIVARDWGRDVIRIPPVNYSDSMTGGEFQDIFNSASLGSSSFVDSSVSVVNLTSIEPGDREECYNSDTLRRGFNRSDRSVDANSFSRRRTAESVREICYDFGKRERFRPNLKRKSYRADGTVDSAYGSIIESYSYVSEELGAPEISEVTHYFVGKKKQKKSGGGGSLAFSCIIM